MLSEIKRAVLLFLILGTMRTQTRTKYSFFFGEEKRKNTGQERKNTLTK